LVVEGPHRHFYPGVEEVLDLVALLEPPLEVLDLGVAWSPEEVDSVVVHHQAKRELH
jgi:hypothetical protein